MLDFIIFLVLNSQILQTSVCNEKKISCIDFVFFKHDSSMHRFLPCWVNQLSLCRPQPNQPQGWTLCRLSWTWPHGLHIFLCMFLRLSVIFPSSGPHSLSCKDLTIRESSPAWGSRSIDSNFFRLSTTVWLVLSTWSLVYGCETLTLLCLIIHSTHNYSISPP